MSDSVDLTNLAKSMPTLQYNPTPLTMDELKGVVRKKQEGRNSEGEELGECPKCGGNLQIRKRRSDGKPFIGCENFFNTRCRYTRELD